MRAYLGRDSHSATDDMTATHATVRHLTCRVAGLGHKIFMENFFSLPKLYDLERRTINLWDSTAQETWHAPWLCTKNTEIEKGWHKSEDVGRFDRISLEGQMWSLHANTDPIPAEGNFCYNSNHPVKPHITASTWVKSTILIIWPTASWWVNLISSRPWNCFSTFWIYQYSTVGFCYLHVGLNIPTKNSDSFWWGIWLKKPRLLPPPDWLEDQWSCKKYCAAQELP